MISEIKDHFNNLRQRIFRNKSENKKENIEFSTYRFRGSGISKIEYLDPPEDLNLEERDKWIETITILAENSISSNVNLLVPFKDSEVKLINKNGTVIVSAMKPKGSNNFDEQIFFTGSKSLTFKEFLTQRIHTFEDIIELEKTVVMLL